MHLYNLQSLARVSSKLHYERNKTTYISNESEWAHNDF